MLHDFVKDLSVLHDFEMDLSLFFYAFVFSCTFWILSTVIVINKWIMNVIYLSVSPFMTFKQGFHKSHENLENVWNLQIPLMICKKSGILPKSWKYM